MDSVDSRLLTPKEAARRLGVSTDTLRRWSDEGRLASETTAGGHRRYWSDDVLTLQSAESAERSRSSAPALELAPGRATPASGLELSELEFPESEALSADEPSWRFRLVLADFAGEESVRGALGLAGMTASGYVAGGGLQFADFECEAPTFGEAVGRMIDAVEGIAGTTRVLAVHRLGTVSAHKRSRPARDE